MLRQQADDVGGKRPRRQTYSIGELARQMELTPRTIRFYEDEGLLTPQRKGHARIYNRRDRARLMLICRGKRLGFSLADIRRFLELYDVDSSQTEQMRYCLTAARDRISVLEHQRRDIDQTLDELREIEADIRAHLNAQAGEAT